MTVADSLLLGLVEGITEFLPVSSTGHLILASGLLGLPQTDFLKTFEIAIQLGAICAVVVLYWRAFLDTKMIKRLVVGFVPTGIIGLILYSFVKEHLLGNETVVLWALFVGGVALIAFEAFHKEREHAAASPSEITYLQAALIGLFQAIAIIPGVSRSAATILGGLALGIKRVAIVEFSFLLAVPTMAAATGLDLLKNYSLFSANDALTLGVGFLTSFLVAIFAIKFLLAFVQSRSFVSFGMYRIILAILFFLFVL